MEVQYIFGSFSRRRHPEESATPKRRSIRKIRTRELVCGLCGRPFCEPRVLPCLHSFCTACLLQLHGSEPVALAKGEESSSGSGYESEGSGSGGGGPGVVLPCPTCGARNNLPETGVEGLPPDYVAQHRMVLASLNQDSTSVLCDLCHSNVPASARCSDCLLSLCRVCCEAHARQRATAGHEVLGMREARQRGITQVRRQAMCPAHPDLELQLFCGPCGQVVCRECCLLGHRGHNCDPAPRAARALTRNLKDGLQRARPLAEEAVVSLDTMRHLEHKIQARCDEVTKEVDRYIDSYVAALEAHRRSLQRQVHEARESKLQRVRTSQHDLERCAEDTRTAIAFAEDLLAEASDIELLSLVMPVLQRLEWCVSKAVAPRVSECLQFLPHESAGKAGDHVLFGVITTQTLSHQHCTLDAENLLDIRQHQRVEAVLVTRDAEKQPLCHGGERVTAELRYRDSSRRKVAVQVTDRRDGTYGLSFVPEVSGNLNLHVSVQGKPIQGSPFHVCVRMIRPHQGMFHCCSFCSSGGSKDATCGCGGKMPGGYRGCGHGHTGHPGRRHWSCCGNILQNSECGRSNSSTYQFTL